MKIIRFIKSFSLAVLFIIILTIVATTIVIFATANEEVAKTQCNINFDEKEMEILFAQKEIINIEYNNSCNHINAVVEVNKELDIEETKGLLVRLAVLKLQLVNNSEIQIFILHPTIKIIALINNGEVIIANK